MLNLYTAFELATAQQLAWERGHDEPKERDLADAVTLAAKWNRQRIKLGLRPWQ